MLRVLRDRWRAAAGLALLAVLAGCAGHYIVQREPWRKDAEVACLKSGTIKESGTIVRVEPINGPGMCGADFPFKVAALGDTAMLGYSGELRPPGSVPSAGPQRWPVTTDTFEPAPPPARSDPRQSPPASQRQSNEPQYSNPMRAAPVQRQPVEPVYGSRNSGAPMTITPQDNGGYQRQPSQPQQRQLIDSRNDPFAVDSPSRGASRAPQSDYIRVSPAGSRKPSVYDAPPPLDDDDEDAPALNGRGAPPSQRQRVQAEPPPFRAAPQRAPISVPLGRGAVAAVGPVEIKPAATLACPIVSALDRWITEAVQPAAQRWFRQPVAEIKQISAYSCRGMNGQPGARISEHAFGNALDIASFTLADGRKITVKNGWRGSPEEQGFLRDVQGAACDSFNTVLAPGSNRFHYDHIHVDLMRRSSGHRICNPDQISGEVVAARAAKERGYAWRPEPSVTGSIGKNSAKGRTAALNGNSAKAKAKSKAKSNVRNIHDDDDWIEDDGPRPED